MYRRFIWILTTVFLFLNLPALAATEQEAARLMQQGDFAAAAQAYAALVQQNPKTLRLRLELADALAKDRQWDRALAEYDTVLRQSPNNVEALRGIGTVNRWRGNIDAAREAYRRALTVAPTDPANTLGLAAIEELDHNYDQARALHQQAEQQWPQDDQVRQAAYDFRRVSSARIYAYYENDLSFRTEIGGVSAPLLAREELGAEYQKETRFNYLTGSESYIRTDKKINYAHFFGLNNSLELDARASAYEYPTPPTPLPPAFSTAIDTFQEYRVRYTYPVTPEQLIAVRYSLRPTTLLNTQQTFIAHKLEANLVSQWQPRLQTLIGTGWLYDLNSNATTINDMSYQWLLKLGLTYTITSRTDVSASFITNPDLDSSINSTTIVQAGYSWTDHVAFLARGRYDDYKKGDDETTAYAAVRFTPSSRLWSEAGIKYVERGPESGIYPLLSVVLHF
jgi:tetratricopeptide (TPR) repeat protein